VLSTASGAVFAGLGRITQMVSQDGTSTYGYEWDYRNRLVKVTEKNAQGTVTQVVEYVYDLVDRRIGRSSTRPLRSTKCPRLVRG
jgi:hypothetical protein